MLMQNRRKFIKQIGTSAVGISVLPSFFSCKSEKKQPPMLETIVPENLLDLPRSTPEEQGILSGAINKFLDSIKKSKVEFHSIMIVRHGHVVAEGWWDPYSPNLKQQLYSISKSFISTAIGFAFDEDLIERDDAVISFFPDDLPDEVSDNLKDLEIKHLLTMSVGHENDPILSMKETDNWAKAFLSIPIVYEPGTEFKYNSGASYMLSAIIQKVTGMTVHEYLKPHLFDPLNIVNSTWSENSQGINIGASHLRLKTEDIAKFGQFYLQKGSWKDKQLLSKKWVKASTKKQIETGDENDEWGYGYGYQFWMNPSGGYRADGDYGQYSIVIPEKDAVIAITGEIFDKKAAMKIVWDLIPEMRDTVSVSEKEYEKLQINLKSLHYDPPKMANTYPIATLISGKEYILEENDLNAKAVSFEFKNQVCIFTLKEEGKKDLVIKCGLNKWIIGDNKKPGPKTLLSDLQIDFDSVVAASATWKSENTLLMTWRFPESTHTDTLTCTFEGKKVYIKFLNSIAASGIEGSDSRKEIIGSSIV